RDHEGVEDVASVVYGPPERALHEQRDEGDEPEQDAAAHELDGERGGDRPDPEEVERYDGVVRLALDVEEEGKHRDEPCEEEGLLPGVPGVGRPPVEEPEEQHGHPPGEGERAGPVDLLPCVRCADLLPSERDQDERKDPEGEVDVEYPPPPDGLDE